MDGRKFTVGQWVEVRSKEEILRTLDQHGGLDGMPFMPEMLAFCGQKFRVHKSAHKTCDTVFPVRSRRVVDAVHLETRCDGSAHGGCQAGCLLFWKTAWLRDAASQDSGADASSASTSSPGGSANAPASLPALCSEDDLARATRSDGATADAPKYVCQATRLPYATQDLSPNDITQYVRDLASGNVTGGRWLRGILYITYQNLINLGIGWGGVLRWIYERFQSIWGGLPYPHRKGRIPLDQKTPTASLELREGELVRVKDYEQILATCHVDNRNRGLGFDGEMMPYCGGTYRVLKRVNKIINERTGLMMDMKNPCIILEGVVCQGRYSECRMFCPREIYPYWREIWLERV